MEQLQISASNVAALLASGYTTIEIWSSPTNVINFAEITAPVVQAAVLNSAQALNTFQMGGFTLGIQINNGTPYTISFSSVLTYWTPAQVAAQINTVIANLATVSADGTTVILIAPTVGRGSQLTITFSNSPNLGFTTGQTANGLDARINLQAGVLVYTYTDVAGTSSALYKWRFSNNGLTPISGYYPSNPISGSLLPLNTIGTSIAVALFADITGVPIQRTLLFANDSSPTQFVSSVAYPSAAIGSEETLIIQTDESGFLQVPLVQGLKLRVAIEGTDYVREITVPTTPTFDLLAAMAAAPDPFVIQPSTPFLIRNSI